MTFFEFWASRRAERRARKADRAMLAAWGRSWVVNRDGIYQLLTAPTPLVVLDVGMLRGVVAEALAASPVVEEQAIAPFSAEPIYGGEPEESFDVEPTAEVESARDDSIFEERNGDAAVPVRPDVNDDDKRRAFMRSFLKQNQRAAKGPVTTIR